MRTALIKDIVRQIRRTLPRFLSIVAIVALGTAFYSGIRSTSPDMQRTGEAYFDAQGLYDLRVVSTYGLNEDDLQAIRQTEGVERMQAAYSTDMLLQREDHERVIKLLSLPQNHVDQLNTPELLSGRMPENAKECVLDTALSHGTQLGDEIVLAAPRDVELSDRLHSERFTVVGIARSPLYASRERGSSSIGSGQVDGYAYLLPEAFALEVYTDAYILTDARTKLSRFDDAYVEYLEPIEDRLEAVGDVREVERYAEIRDEVQEKLDDGKQQIADAEAKLADAQQQLDDAQVKLEDGEQKLADGEQKLADAQKDYDKGIRDGEKQLKDARKKLSDAQKEITSNQKKLDDGKAQLATGKKELNAAKKKLSESKAQVQELKTQLDALRGQIAQLEAMEEPDPETLATAQAQLAQLQAAYDQAAPQLEAGQKEITANQRKLDASEKTLNDGQKKIDQAKTELTKGQRELRKAENEFAEKKAEGAQKLADAKDELAEHQKELADAKVELADAQKEFAEKKVDAEKDIAQAKVDIADGEEKFAELKTPEWYILNLETNPGFSSYHQDTNRIAAIGGVFPILFFLVAALVCLTAMTRMVDEERVAIGTMKALGYSRTAISMKYLIYALSATLLGSAIGISVGSSLFPKVIFQAYSMLYSLPAIQTPLNLQFALGAAGVAVGATSIVTLLACRTTLRVPSAQLMRPKAPKAGKRIFLEKIPALWNHVSFTWKVALRNLFRYKTRLMMTIVGIAGCTALLLTGFGLRDSITSIVELQFSQVRKYHAMIALEDGLSADKRDAVLETLEALPDVKEYAPVAHQSADVSANGASKNAYLLIPDANADITKYIELRDRRTHEPVPLSDDGVVITEKLSQLLGVKVGDAITLMNSDNQQAQSVVRGIVENYAMHYAYIQPAVYASLFHRSVEYAQLMVTFTQDTTDAEEALSSAILEMDGVKGIDYSSTIRRSFDDMVKNLIVVVLVLILSAGLLAFVVLFNLNSVNIDERQRELATIKVLGFRDMEVFSYVTRETVLLTLLGAAAGLFLGVWLHRFVILTAEVDMVMFSRSISTMSYVYSFVLTIAFGLVTNALMNIRLKKIDMVESLKSIE